MEAVGVTSKHEDKLHEYEDIEENYARDNEIGYSNGENDIASNDDIRQNESENENMLQEYEVNEEYNQMNNEVDYDDDTDDNEANDNVRQDEDNNERITDMYELDDQVDMVIENGKSEDKVIKEDDQVNKIKEYGKDTINRENDDDRRQNEVVIEHITDMYDWTNKNTENPTLKVYYERKWIKWKKGRHKDELRIDKGITHQWSKTIPIGIVNTWNGDNNVTVTSIARWKPPILTKEDDIENIGRITHERDKGKPPETYKIPRMREIIPMILLVLICIITGIPALPTLREIIPMTLLLMLSIITGIQAMLRYEMSIPQLQVTERYPGMNAINVKKQEPVVYHIYQEHIEENSAKVTQLEKTTDYTMMSTRNVKAVQIKEGEHYTKSEERETNSNFQKHVAVTEDNEMKQKEDDEYDYNTGKMTNRLYRKEKTEYRDRKDSVTTYSRPEYYYRKPRLKIT